MIDIYHAVLRTHQRIYQRTNGLLGHRLLFGKPTLLLRTTGRRTRRTRTTALIYARDGDAHLVVASNGGAAKPPAWLANLTTHPECEIQIGRTRIPVVARPTSPDDPDYARRWKIADAVNSGRYTKYQHMTHRRIPVIELRPRPAAHPSSG